MSDRPAPSQQAPDWSHLLLCAMSGHANRGEGVRLAEWLKRPSKTNAEKRLRKILSINGWWVECGQKTLVWVAQTLLDLGANPNKKSNDLDDGETALIAAARRGLTDCVKLLLPLADPHEKDANGRTALMIAALKGNDECLDLLLPHSAVDESGPVGLSALVLAAKAGSANCLDKLLKSERAVGRKAEEEGSAMMWAAAEGRAKCVELLIPTGAARAVSSEGATALMHAARQGHAECVGALIPHSDLQAVCVRGNTALMYAAECRTAPEPLSLLLPHFDARKENHRGETAFDIAVSRYAWGCADLLAHAVDVKKLVYAIREAPKTEMPVAKALIERAALSAAVRAQGNSGDEKTTSAANSSQKMAADSKKPSPPRL